MGRCAEEKGKTTKGKQIDYTSSHGVWNRFMLFMNWTYGIPAIILLFNHNSTQDLEKICSNIKYSAQVHSYIDLFLLQESKAHYKEGHKTYGPI